MFKKEIRFPWVVVIGHEFDENCLKIDQQTVLSYFRRFLISRELSSTLACRLLVEFWGLVHSVHREVLETSVNHSKLDSKIPSVAQSTGCNRSSWPLSLVSLALVSPQGFHIESSCDNILHWCKRPIQICETNHLWRSWWWLETRCFKVCKLSMA